MNISFTKECEACETHYHHIFENEPMERKRRSEDPTRGRRERRLQHLHGAHADVARNNDPMQPIFLMDMQKVLMLPHLPGTKTALFTWRITFMNQSIVPVG